MIKNVVYGSILVVILATAVLFYSTPAPPISGVTAADVATSIASNVESSYEGVIVTAVVTQPDEASNVATVQYVLVINMDPALFSAQPTTQAEAVEQQNAFAALQGSMASLLSLSQQYLTGPNPTVAGVSLSVLFLDGGAYNGTVSSKDLNAIPQGSTEQEWLSVMALAPQVMIPQTVWEMVTTIPAVRKLLDQQ